MADITVVMSCRHRDCFLGSIDRILEYKLIIYSNMLILLCTFAVSLYIYNLLKFVIFVDV